MLATIPTWLKIVNVSTLLAILIAVVTFAFYLGGMSNKLTVTAQNVENLNNAVAGAHRDSIASRISVIETKLDNLQPKAH
jgi:hypothetical protein